MPDLKGVNSRNVDALKCAAHLDRVFVWDDKLPGFGVAAFPSGKKVYVFQYRFAGKTKRLKLGTHGAITPRLARELAKIEAGKVAGGKNPVAERKAESGVRPFKEIGDEYLKAHVAKKCKPRTAEEYDRLLRLHIYPAFGSKRDVRKADVARLHESMSDTPSAANRAVTLVASIWNWGKDRDEPGLGDNPAARVEHYPEKNRERFLSFEEVGRLGDAIRLAETTGIEWTVDETKPKAKHLRKKNRKTIIDPHAAAAIRLLILTGARLREILHAKWDYVDWDHGILRLPDSKTGRKTIYLSAPALAVLQDIPRIDGNPYIIAGHGPHKRKGSKAERKAERNTSRVDLKNPWAAVVRAAGLVERRADIGADGKPILDDKGKPKTVERATVRIHDLRHSFASVGAGASLGLPIIGKLLGHSQPGTTARYSHLDADPLRRAADVIGAKIAAAMEGKRAEVVPMQGKK